MKAFTNPTKMKYVKLIKTKILGIAFFVISTSFNFLADKVEIIKPEEIDIDWENDDDWLGI